MVQADRAIDVAPLAVRAAMADGVGHVREHGALHGQPIAVDDADDAAHR